MIKKIILAFFILFIAIPALAVETPPRFVNVTGEGEVTVVPDEVLLNLQVESFDADLSRAKRSNDEAVKKTLAIVKKFNIADKDFQTDYFAVRAGDRYYFEPGTNVQQSKKGYFVTKNVAIRLRDISKFEDLYSEALTAGVNNIYGVSFQTSALEKHRAEAREKAALDAKEKAARLAAALGQEIGRPLSIQEGGSVGYPPPMPRMLMAQAADMAVNNETIALGQIKITSSVSVSFELK